MKHERKGLNRALFWLYEGHGKWPFIFRWALLIFDFVTIAYFLWAPFEQRGHRHVWLDYVIGGVIALVVVATLAHSTALTTASALAATLVCTAVTSWCLCLPPAIASS